ncbi:gliding motility-associated C-terminal domain-containing protein [Flagellimonas olearia]|nr:gliding motility-associated C-terminal domain-containing protein [Allomuricauda olearia]
MYSLKRNLIPYRKSLVGLLLALFGLSFYHLGRGAMEPKGTWSITTPNPSTKAEGLYVTNLLVFMAGIVNSDCSAIDYTITIRNASTAGESFAENQITIGDSNDPLFIVNMVPSDKTGDATPASFDPGDSWEYMATRALGATDLNLDQIQNQATVTAGGIDFLSDDLALPGSNDPTLTNISRCRSIGAVLSVETKDWFGNAPGCETIEYQLSVQHNGVVKESLTNIQITNIGPNLTFVLETPNAGDVNSNNFLDANEIWKYTATRPLDQNDYDIITLKEQVTVSAEVDGNPAATVSDLSHPSDFLDDGTTDIDINCEKGTISLIKTATDLGTCNQILYTFTLTHLNTVPYSFINVTVEDPVFGGYIAIPPIETMNADGKLEPGEIWTYQLFYNITLDNITDGKVVNQAYAKAEAEGKTPLIVSVDASDPSDPNQDRETVTDLSACAPDIAIVKTGIAQDDMGNDGGCFRIRYTFLVTNEGENGNPLHNITLTDDLVGNIGYTSGDNGDNILQAGETWEYTGFYAITPEDLAAKKVENTAHVSGEDPLLGLTVEDWSDFENVDEDRPTVTDISNCVPRIALLKTGVAKDGFGNDGGCVYIDYTFTLTNESTENQTVDNVIINDLDLGFVLNAPTEGDIGNDGLLGPNEKWIYSNVDYLLTTDDRIAGEVQNRAVVTATMAGFPEITIEDYSDYESIDEDRPTITKVSDCEPRIALIKTGMVNADCSAIDYTFTVTNESNTGEVFENVVVTDLDLPLVINGPVGDLNNDTLLDPDETWTYTATQPISPDDINFGCFHNQAQVTANVLGFVNLPVQDLSDDNSPDEDDVTEVDLSSCQNPAVGLIKQAELLDINNDGCPESVAYTFTLENIGDADLHEAVLNDDMLNGEVPGPTPESDDGGDGILSVGEIWTYQAIYNIVQTDIDNGFVENTATVTLSNLCATAEATDTSDDNSNTEDDPTNITIPNDACTDGNASIGLIKTGIIQDVNQDNCPESILYTFTVTNNGDVGLDTVELMDDALGGAIPGPVPGTDENEDGVLSPNETWTYEFLYDLVQEDIDAGSKENQATVSAEPLGFDIKIQDDSDDNSLLENDITSTTVPNNACTTGSASLGLTKMGALADVNQDGCFESILYTFVVINNGEVDLDTVEITDNVLGATLNEPLPGEDEGNDGILSIGESWTYQALYAILDTDINNTYVQNTAQVTAELINTAIGVQDTSHPSDPLSDGPTITDVPANACTNGSAGIGLIKKGDLADAKGDGCMDSITYTFTVTNTGEVDLEELLLEDEKLGGYIAGPVPGTDDGNDGILSIGESWTFRTSHPLTQQDIDNGSVTNQAMVTSQPVGFEAQVIDLSDDNSLDENDQTVTMVPSDACPSEGTDPNFEIYTGITPNGDGINDFFRIDGIEAYPNNTLRIFNRWGALVYEADGYGIGNEVFTGVSEGQATIMKDRSLPSGTYFYILEFETENPGEAAYSGYLYINRD